MMRVTWGLTDITVPFPMTAHVGASHSRHSNNFLRQKDLLFYLGSNFMESRVNQRLCYIAIQLENQFFELK